MEQDRECSGKVITPDSKIKERDRHLMVKRILSQNFEFIVWVSALVWLAWSDPTIETHFTLCPLRNLGIEWCPGCGLGRAISYALHGNLAGSIQYHLLGIPAIVILAARATSLARQAFLQFSQSHHHTAKETVCPTSCN